MLARYLEYLDRTTDAAVVRRVATGESHANERGRALVAAEGERFDACFRAASETGSIVEHTFEGGRLAFVPLFEERERVEAVLATSAAVVELPRILHQMHSTLRHFAQIVHLLPQIVLTARPNGRIDYASRRWFEVAHVGRHVVDMHASVLGAVEETERDSFEAQWQSGIAAGVEFGFEFFLRTAAGLRCYALRANPWSPQSAIVKWAVSLTDVDAEVRARAALERAQRRLRLLADVGRILNGATDPLVIAREVVRALAQWSGSTAIVELRDDGERLAVATQPADGQLVVERLSSLFARHEAPDLGGIPGLSAVKIRGLDRSGRGFLAILRPDPPQEPDEDALLLADVAGRVDVALESALAYGREHAIADALQRAMLPLALPQLPGISFDVAYAPAGARMLVGGDWYDSFVLANGHVAFTIGDVAGHGLNAAIMMANVRRTIRSAALAEADPAAILERANAVACADRCPMATVFLGILDPLTLWLEYASAGHPPPIVVDHTGSLQTLEPDGPPLGVLENLRLTTRTIELTERCAVVLYTDGVVEAHLESPVGEGALHNALRGWAAHHFRESAEVLQGRIIGPVASDDDAAMLIVRLRSPDELNFTFPATADGSHRARAAVQRYVNNTQLDADRAFAFALAIAEAMNNAAEHAYPDQAGSVALHLRSDAADLIAVISDGGRWRVERPSDRGRGLTMMRALADDCDVHRSDAGTVVTLSMRLPVSDAAFRSA